MRLIAAVLIAALVGCSSGYMPQARGRVAVTMIGGTPAYVRDGKTYPHGLLGGGLVDAVQGVPAAEHAAGEYRGRLKTGLLVALGGMVCTGVAMGLALRHVDDTDPYDDRNEVPTEALVGLGCLVVAFGGLGYLFTAEPYRWDAINIFNDSVLPPPGAPGAPGSLGLHALPRKTMSLRMRDDQ
jgi:hypothetical protein